jgi:hypothetical protein
MSSTSENSPTEDADDLSLPLFHRVDNNNNADTKEDRSLPLCKLSPSRKLVLLKPALFVRKVILVVLASYALLPLLAYKSSLPGALYVSLLILIHIGVLGLYLYKVTFRDLDVDRISLGGRILGLALMIWLLAVVAGWEDRTHMGVLAVEMLVLCLVHTLVLALLMVAVEEAEPTDHDTN